MTFVLLRGHSKHAETASWQCQVGRNQLALLPEGTQRRLARLREAMHAVTAVLLVAHISASCVR